MTIAPPAIATARNLYDQASLPGAVGAWECRLAKETLSWTDGVYDLFGLPRGSTPDRRLALGHYHEASRREMERLRAEAIRTGRGFALDCRIRTTHGEDRWMRLLVGVGYEHGRPARIFGSKQDVTAEKRMWEGLTTATRQAPLTDLQGRRGIVGPLGDLLERRVSRIDHAALVIFDLVGAEALCECFGPDARNDVLRCLEMRIGRLFSDALLSERVGPTEFALLLPLATGLQPLAATLAGASALISRPIPRNASIIEISVAIGAALLKPAHREDPRRLFAEAESALLAARAAGRNQVRIFGGFVAPPPRLAVAN